MIFWDAANLGNVTHADSHGTCSPVVRTGYIYVCCFDRCAFPLAPSLNPPRDGTNAIMGIAWSEYVKCFIFARFYKVFGHIL